MTEARRKRVRARWAPGTVLWQVPIRFYDDPPPEPTRLVVTTDDSKDDYEGVFSTYAFHAGWGHDAYFNPDDLYETVEACQAEIARRRAVKNVEHRADVDKIMARMAELRAQGKSPFRALQERWNEGDERAPSRFTDTARFAAKGSRK